LAGKISNLATKGDVIAAATNLPAKDDLITLLSDVVRKSDIILATRDIPTSTDLIPLISRLVTKLDIEDCTKNLLTKATFLNELTLGLTTHTSPLLKEGQFSRDNQYNVLKMTQILRRINDVFSRVDLLSKDQFWCDIKDEISLDVADQLAFVAKSDRLDRIYQDLSDMFDLVATTSDVSTLTNILNSLSQAVANVNSSLITNNTLLRSSDTTLSRNTDLLGTIRHIIESWKEQMVTEEFDKWVVFKEELTDKTTRAVDSGVRTVNDMIVSHEEKEEKRSHDLAEDKSYTHAYLRDIHRWSEDMLTILEALEKFMRARPRSLPPSREGSDSEGDDNDGREGRSRSRPSSQSRNKSRSPHHEQSRRDLDASPRPPQIQRRDIAFGGEPDHRVDAAEQPDKRPGTADSGRAAQAKKARCNGKWVEFEVGDAARKGYAMPALLADSPLPSWIKEHVHKEGVKARELSVRYNADRPVMCWMSKYFPSKTWDRKDVEGRSEPRHRGSLTDDKFNETKQWWERVWIDAGKECPQCTDRMESEDEKEKSGCFLFHDEG
jgi:hypothetical protein